MKTTNSKNLLDALKKAYSKMHELSNIYCRDKEGYLKPGCKGWDAELDIELSGIIKKHEISYETFDYGYHI